MSYVRRDHIEVDPGEPVVERPIVAASTTRQTISTHTFSIPSVVAGVAGIALIVIGAVAIARTDLDAPLSEPVVEVAGFAHNATLGIVELVAGLCLLAAAVTRSRGAIMFVSIVVGVAAVISLIEPTVGGRHDADRARLRHRRRDHRRGRCHRRRGDPVRPPDDPGRREPGFLAAGSGRPRRTRLGGRTRRQW